MKEISKQKDVDVSMIKLVFKVMHQSFGEGVAIKKDNGKVIIQFIQGQKQFLVQDAFNTDY